MATSNSKQSNLNMTEKTNKDGKATDMIERKPLKHQGQNTDINTDTEHFCRNVSNNGGRQAQEENHLSSSAVKFHVVDPPARTIDQSDNEDRRLRNECQSLPKPVQNIGEDKALSDQPLDIDLDMDLPKCKNFQDDNQDNIQRKYEKVPISILNFTDNTNISQMHEIVTTKPEPTITSQHESNNEMHLSETELGTLGVDNSYQEHFPQTMEYYLNHQIEYQSNGYHQTEYHRYEYHLTEYHTNKYQITKYCSNEYHQIEYHSNGYHRTENYSSMMHELFVNFNCQQTFRPLSLSLSRTSQIQDYLLYINIGWYYKTLKDTLGLKKRVYKHDKYFEEYSNCQFQYSFTDKMHVNRYYLKHTDKVLIEQYQCNVIVYPVVRVEPEYMISPVNDNDIDPQGLITIYDDSEVDVHDYNGLVAHAQAAHADILSITVRSRHTTTEDNNITASNSHSPAITMISTARGIQCTDTRETYTMTTGIVQNTAITTNMSARAELCTDTRETYTMTTGIVQNTAITTNMSARAELCTDTRETYTMTTGIVQHTANTTNMSARAELCTDTRETYTMTTGIVQNTAITTNMSARAELCTDTRETYTMTAGIVQNTAITTSMSARADLCTGTAMHISARSLQRALAYSMTAATSHYTDGACCMSIGTVLRVIESDPVRIEGQPVGANHLADLIQHYVHQYGLQLQSTPIAGEDRPDMCSPDTVTTVLTSAVLQNRFILDHFRTMGAPGAQVLEIVRNYLHQNYGSVTADIRQMVFEKHGDAGDIHSEVDVISAIIGDTKIKIMTTCSNQDCEVINSRMIESPLIMRYQGTLTSTSVGNYLSQHLMGKEEHCSYCPRISPGIKGTVRSIESTFIYINASPGRVPKANVKDMILQFCVCESAYQVHALSFWDDYHFTVRINIDNMWWTYDNKRGIFNQGLEVDDGMPGTLSGIYLKKIG